jgi:hypothetical protein
MRRPAISVTEAVERSVVAKLLNTASGLLKHADESYTVLQINGRLIFYSPYAFVTRCSCIAKVIEVLFKRHQLHISTL